MKTANHIQQDMSARNSLQNGKDLMWLPKRITLGTTRLSKKMETNWKRSSMENESRRTTRDHHSISRCFTTQPARHFPFPSFFSYQISFRQNVLMKIPFAFPKTNTIQKKNVHNPKEKSEKTIQ